MPGIFISLAISFLLFLYAPVDLYCANTAEFWFDFSTLLITALGMFDRLLKQYFAGLQQQVPAEALQAALEQSYLQMQAGLS